MKTKLVVFALLIAAGLGACKDKEATPAEGAAAAKPEVKKQFSVEMDVIALKDDHFSVYYTEDNSINFVGEKAVWQDVKGQPQSQKLVFNLSEDILPTNIRLDFGNNKEQGDIVLEKFKFSYYGNSVEIRGADLLKYYLPCKEVDTKIDEANGTITFLQKPGKYAPPFFYPFDPGIKAVKDVTNP